MENIDEDESLLGTAALPKRSASLCHFSRIPPIKLQRKTGEKRCATWLRKETLTSFTLSIKEVLPHVCGL